MPADTDADAYIHALRFSADRLRELTGAMTEAALSESAYPSEWTIAQVLSHLGSAAVIMQRRLADTLAGKATPDDFAPSVWESWNAKPPVQQRDDALAADSEFLARIEAVTAEQRAGFTFVMGPISVGFAQFVGLRLNEHALHTWDIDVAVDDAAALPDLLAALVVDSLDLVARYTGKPTGDATTIVLATTAPDRTFTVELTPDAVTLAPGTATGTPDVTLPAEAFIRLIYGRMDSGHTPQGAQAPALDTLRRVFPGP
ncbi:MAG: hypothetical protein QOH89_1878 [Pseudonocardiales bacterium]|nr:hypothetical protein [Pseudonocardiales bacterium]